MKSSDGLIKQANIMFFAGIVGGLGNFLFQIFMNRGLQPGDFAAFSSLLALFVIISVPGVTIQTVIAKQVSHYRANGDQKKIASLFLQSLGKVSLLGGVLLIIFMVASRFLTRFLKIDSQGPIIITGIALGMAFLAPVAFGTLQGLQKFVPWAVNGIASVSARLIAGIILVFFGFRVAGAMGSSIIAAVVSLGLALFSLKFLFGQDAPREKIDFMEMYRYSLPVLGALFFLALLQFVDIVLVKHFFSKTLAADYSTASVLGRTIVYLPAAVSAVMFPKVSEEKTRGGDSFPLLKQSLIYSLLLCFGAALFFFLFPKLIINIFRPAYAATVPPLLKVFGFALIPLALTTILVYYNLAVHRMKFIYGLGGGVMLHIILLSRFHATLPQVILVLGISGTFIFILVSAFGWSRKSKEKRSC
ncbi:MAG: hypothetical protein GXO98_07725 [Nitrospirae bacterium]|nr:hypothetical protein [Nitrospirota bacterium]